MMNQTTLPSPQLKKETKLNLSQVIGGGLEEIYENITGIPQSPEAREPITTPVPEYVQKTFSSGEINNFQTPKFNTEIHRRTLEAQLAKAHQKVLTTVPITAKRIDVNTRIGGIGNVLYEDTVSDDGTLRRDVETYLSRKNSELEVEQLKAKRKSQLVQATEKSAPKGAVGPKINLNTRFEDRNTDSPG